MNSWLEANHRRRTDEPDAWYVRLANELLSVVDGSLLFKDVNEEQRIKVVLALGLYMQDAVAQTGGWVAFKEAYRKLYNEELPFYKPDNEYVADEVNWEDVALVLWTRLARPACHKANDYTLHDPYDTELIRLAQDIYGVLNRLFEEAPIAETPSPDTWLMNIDCLRIPSASLPDSQADKVFDRNARLCLAYSNGEPLLFFHTYVELADFFVHTLGWENRAEELLPELHRHSHFVIYANAKGMLIAPDVAYYFHAPHNALYSSDETRRTGHRLFCEPGACPFDLLKYGILKGYLENVALPVDKGKSILHDNKDFLMRYYLEEYYEGK